MEYEGKICKSDFERATFKLPISVGCSYNRCRFCCLFHDLVYREIEEEKIFEEIKRVKEANGNPESIYLGDGNAFHNNTNRLIKIINELHKNFSKLKYINMDATVSDIKNKSKEELKILSELGVHILYIGIETGLDDVLEYMNKDHRTNAEAKEQIERIHNVGIEYGAHMMTGICGRGRGIENAKLLAKFYNETRPINITNFSLFIIKKYTLYKEIIEGKFIPATELENLEEIKELIKNINVEVSLDSFHDYIPFRVKGNVLSDKKEMILKINNMIEKMKKENIDITLDKKIELNKELMKRAGYDDY